MIGSDNIEVPGQGQNLGNANGSVTVSDLIDESTAIKWTGTKGVVSGTVKKDPSSVQSLYGANEKTGHFFPVKFEEKYYNQNVELSGRTDGNRTIKPTTEDPYLIIRLENLDGGNKLTAKVVDTQEEIFELDFGGVDKAEE